MTDETPSWADNPFGNGADEGNALNDNSVTQSSTMPEYDPFSNQETATVTTTTENKNFTATSTSEKTPDWAQQNKTITQEPKVTQEDQNREAQYQQNQQQAENNLPSHYRVANWPPFPKGCRYPFKPCFHHNFKGEIPEWGYKETKLVYYSWVFYFLALFWNLITAFSIYGVGMDSEDKSNVTVPQIWGLALLWAVILPPLAYCCWFQPLYQAMRKDSSLRFGWFFFTYLFQWLVTCAITVGNPYAGTVALWSGIMFAQGNVPVVIIVFINAALWIFHAIFVSYMLSRVLRVYRSSGQSFEKAQNEAISGAAPVVGKAVMKSQMQSA